MHNRILQDDGGSDDGVQDSRCDSGELVTLESRNALTMSGKNWVDLD
jgi:hypothetical protein